MARLSAVSHDDRFFPGAESSFTDAEHLSPDKRLLKAIIETGEIIPVVELPVIEIISDQSENKVYRAKMEQGELIVLADLPPVDVIADLNIEIIYPAVILQNEIIARVDLPEVIISGSANSPDLAVNDEKNEHRIFSISAFAVFIPIAGIVLPALKFCFQSGFFF